MPRRNRAEKKKKTLGLIINPIAGMGGRVGLKGTDGAEAVREARAMGASPESPRRAAEALTVVGSIKGEVDVFTYPEEMGETVLTSVGFEPNVIGSIVPSRTTPVDTENAAKDMLRLRVDLLLFAGGDGTARDIYRVVGRGLVVLGIPTGVKMHSAVFALTPRIAGDVAVEFLRSDRPGVAEGEVMDIDEPSFRRGVVDAKLFGYLRIPEQDRHLQSAKSGSIHTEKQVAQGIATEIFTTMERGCLYIVGPGSTTRDVLAALHLEKTLLGVDVLRDGRFIIRDANERQISDLLGNGQDAKIVVSPIGGQGYIFGRGNQQLSSEIIQKVGKKNIIVVASKQKLASLGGRPFLVDTGDARVDRSLDGYTRVVVGRGDYVMYRIMA